MGVCVGGSSDGVCGGVMVCDLTVYLFDEGEGLFVVEGDLDLIVDGNLCGTGYNTHTSSYTSHASQEHAVYITVYEHISCSSLALSARMVEVPLETVWMEREYSSAFLLPAMQSTKLCVGVCVCEGVCVCVCECVCV